MDPSNARLLLSAVVIIFSLPTGIIVGAPYWGRLNLSLAYKFALAPVGFFLGNFWLFTFHLLSGGRVLNSTAVTWAAFLAILALHFYFGRQTLAQDLLVAREKLADLKLKNCLNQKIYIAAGLSLLIAGFFLWPALAAVIHRIDLSADTSGYLRGALQLINGYSYPHYPSYENVKQFNYPFLSFSATAMLIRLFGANIYNSYMACFLLQALTYIMGAYLFVHRLTGNRWLGVAGMALLGFYCLPPYAFWPSAQATWMMVLGRNLAFAFIPFGLFFLLMAGGEGGKRAGVCAGIMIGLTASGHSYPFLMLISACFFYLLLNIWQPACRRDTLIAFGTGLATAAVSFASLLIGHFYQVGDLTVVAPNTFFGSYERQFQDNIYPYLGQINFWRYRFGLMGFAALAGICLAGLTRGRKMYWALAISMVFLLALTTGKDFLDFYADIVLGFHPFQKKIMVWLSFGFLVLGLGLLHGLLEAWRKHRSKFVLCVLCLIAVVMAGDLCRGAYFFWKNHLTQMTRMDKNYQTQKVWSVDQRWPQHLLEQIIKIGQPQRLVVAANPGLAGMIADLTGLPMLYSTSNCDISMERYLASAIVFAPNVVKKMSELDDRFSYDDLFAAVLRFYDVGMLVQLDSPSLVRYFASREYLRLTARANLQDGNIYALFLVDKSMLNRQISRGQAKSVLERFFRNSPSAYMVLGYYPLTDDRSLRPKVAMHTMWRISGIGWDGENFLVQDRRNRKIYTVEPKHGRVLKELTVCRDFGQGIVSVGPYLWMPHPECSAIMKLDRASGKILKIAAVESKSIRSLAWDGSHLWTVDPIEKNLLKLDPDSGIVLKSIKVPMVPMSVTFGDGYLWVAYDKYIGRIDPGGKQPETLFSGLLSRIGYTRWDMLCMQDGYLWSTERNAAWRDLLGSEKDSFKGRNIFRYRFMLEPLDMTLQAVKKRAGLKKVLALKQKAVDLLHYKRNYQAALDVIDQLLLLMPSDPDTYRERALANSFLGRHRKSVADLDKAIKLSPKDSEFYYLRGNELVRLGLLNKAERDFTRALKLRPEDRNVRNALNSLRAAMNAHNTKQRPRRPKKP